MPLQFFIVHTSAKHLLIYKIEGFLILGIDDELIDTIQEIVTHGSVHGPVLLQVLERCQNFFHNQINRQFTRTKFLSLSIKFDLILFGGSHLQLQEIIGGIVQTIRVIYSQSVDLPFTNQAKNELVHL